jgi:hypothetical protein
MQPQSSLDGDNRRLIVVEGGLGLHLAPNPLLFYDGDITSPGQPGRRKRWQMTYRR